MFDFLKKWGLDPKTVLYTLLVIPIFLVIKRIIVRYVKEWVEYLSEGLMFILSKYVKQSLAGTLSMRRYCRLQLGNEKIRYLHIPSSLDISLDIDKIFVNLTISYLDERENSFNHKDFLTIGNRIKVMGDPGAGKSSLIKRVFRDACQLGAKKPRKTKLPVLIELKNVNPENVKEQDLGKWLYNEIKEETSKNKVFKMDECFENYAVTKGILLLLDGLDEVSSVNYPTVAKCINELSMHLNELSKNNTIVLTMRAQFYQQIKTDFVDHFPHSTFLKPFTPSDIFEFLSRWHFDKEAEHNISRIYKDLTDRPTLREMCSNPLVLSMYVAEDQISKGNISPESRTQFYGKVTEELIIKRRLMQKLPTAISYSSLKEQRERILGKIAYNHLVNINEPSNVLKWSDALLVIQEILKCDQLKAESVFNEISKETGLITEERYQESFRFIHLTFCEFLAAFEVVQGIEDGWKQIVEYHKIFSSMSLEGKSRLIEVIPFTAGLLPRIKRELALNDIDQINDTNLMSRCFLETKLYSHESWENFIRISKETLLKNVGNNFDEKWLQDLHVFNVVVRDANLASENINVGYIDLTEFYETLLDNDKARLNKILSSFASQDAAAVFRLSEVCNIDLLKDFRGIVVQNCDQMPFLGLIKDKIVQSPEDADDWAALLAESALQKKIVCSILNDMLKDESLSIRIKENEKYRIWYYKQYVKETFFTQCLTIATNRNLELNHTECVNLIMQLKTPYENRLKLIINSYIFVVYVIIIWIFMFVFRTYFKPFNKELEMRSTIKIEILGFFVLFQLSTFFIINLRRRTLYLYEVALNLRSSDFYFKKNSPKQSFFIYIIRLLIIVFLGKGFASLRKKDREVLSGLLKLRGETPTSAS